MKTIIFDMDGTLINSGKVITNSINFVRENIGLKKMDEEKILEYINTPNINTAEILYETREFTERQSKIFEEYYINNCTKDIELYHGIEEVLKTLHKENRKLAIATNAFSNFAKEMLEHLNIYKYFDIVVGADMVKEPKPHPEMILKVIDDLNAHKSSTILIGDSHKDRLSAQSAEIKFLLVNWGFSKHNDNAIHKAKDILNNL